MAAPVHPGAVLRNELPTPMEPGVYRLAREIKVSRLRPNDIVFGHRAVTTDTALHPGRHSGATPDRAGSRDARRAMFPLRTGSVKPLVFLARDLAADKVGNDERGGLDPVHATSRGRMARKAAALSRAAISSS